MRKTTNNKLSVSLIIVLFLMLMFFIAKELQKPSIKNINSSTLQIIKPPQEKYDKTSILVFGDMMLDRFVRQKINENGAEYPFELIKDFILNNDIVVVNAEGSFTFFDSVTVGRKNAPLNFTFDTDLLPTLKNLGFTLLGQANNHTLNFGTEGFSQSKTLISMSGLNYFGDPMNESADAYIENINLEKIGFIAYNEFSYQGLENLLAAIRKAKEALSYIIVYPHWGEEYNLDFTSLQQKTAHSFLDAGADAVIGMHPHVIEPIEIYKGKPIFYSIGNFIFDQSETGPTGKGLAIRIILEKNLAAYYINPFNIKQAQASLMIDDLKQKELNSLSESMVASDSFKKEIATGIIKITR